MKICSNMEWGRRRGGWGVMRDVDGSSWDWGSPENVCTSSTEVPEGSWSTRVFEAPAWLITSGTPWFLSLVVITPGSQWTAAHRWKCKFYFFSSWVLLFPGWARCLSPSRLPSCSLWIPLRDSRSVTTIQWHRSKCAHALQPYHSGLTVCDRWFSVETPSGTQKGRISAGI